MHKRIWSWGKSRRSILLLLACAMLATFLNSAPKVAAQEQTPTVRTAPLFDFHSNFWVNLHQVLRHEALLRAGRPDRRLQGNASLTAPQVSEAEKEQWNAAIDFYFKTFETRQGVFDDELVQINNDLAEQPDDGADLNPAGLPPEVVAVLRSAAPIYRKYWWPAQDKSNKDWIASERERVQNLGPKLAAAMTKDLHQQWPAAPLRVDVCYYVPEIGNAYTTDSPPHTTFSSSAPTLADLSGFETLFHEASHSFVDKMTDALFKECGIEKKNCGDLWHAVLFYTSGVELRRLLPPDEQAGFTPYAYKYSVYTRGDWPKYRVVLEKDWQAYLDGKMSFKAALRAMAADLQ